MRIRLAALSLAASLAGPAVWAESGGAAAPTVTKVGVINVQVAITSTSEGKQAAAELQSQCAPRQSELEGLRRQVEDIQTRLRTGASTLSDDEKVRLSREGDQLSRQFQRKQQDSQDDFNEAQREVVDRIGRKMIDVLDKYSRENGYGVIFDTSAQNTPVVYAANQIDVTQEIIRLYDQNYPVKAGAAKSSAPPRSAAPKPASATPGQPKQ